MRRLYLTHDPAELLMAMIQADCAIAGLWMAFTADWHIWVRLLIGQFGIAAAVVCWVFLFDMSGSRRRREAAEKTGA